MKIDFDGLQAFVAIADLGGFGKAAETLHLTQTALTRRLQKLEGWLGLQLVERSTRRVALTAVGREFLPQARAMVQDVSGAMHRLKEMAQHGHGQFTLACIPSMTSHVLPGLISQYAQRHPGNHIRLLDGASTEVRQAVLGGQAELGVALAGERHAELAETALFEDPLVFICRESHPLAAQDSLRWDDMRGQDLVGVNGFMATRIEMDYQLAKRGITLAARYEVQHHATALNLVAAGVGCAILPASTFREGDRPGVRRLALTQPTVRRQVRLLQRRHGVLSPAAQAFVQLLREVDWAAAPDTVPPTPG
ncbi:LysR family transcriptional regulator [Ideonella livida]|uniref:LysR family transcriptional regulator n=1 Tax=Ideonella livida TaxID=2707176 RepID=A0A7C9PK03_9BURK|nr:LysR family transcriptional regulator [Ideonella livida]NDY93111.1 LysR family transcriptional regulator [Ideonella livida]